MTLTEQALEVQRQTEESVRRFKEALSRSRKAVKKVADRLEHGGEDDNEASY